MKHQTKKYHAFISYRHADNTEEGRQWATWLHQAIETYAVPKELVGKKNERGETIPARIYPIFRDEEELPADSDLGNVITKALDNTLVLVVLCSPNAVASTYVADEIDYFKKKGGSNRIIAAMLRGEPNVSWDESKLTLGFTKEDECFPIPLQFQYDDKGNQTSQRAEPIAADFRLIENNYPKEGWTSPEAYRIHLKSKSHLNNSEIGEKVEGYEKQLKLMLLKIIAGILGVPLSELTQRDKEYQLELERKKAKQLRRWLSAVALLAIIAIGVGIFAFYKQQQATNAEKVALNERNKASKERDEALLSQSRFLMDQAYKSNQNAKYELALLLSLHALPGDYGGQRPDVKNLVEIRSALHGLLKKAVFFEEFVTEAGEMILVKNTESSIQVLLIDTWEELYSIPNIDEMHNLKVCIDNALLSIHMEDQTKIYDLNNGKLLKTLPYNSKLYCSNEKNYILLSNMNGEKLQIWDKAKDTKIFENDFVGGNENIYNSDIGIIYNVDYINENMKIFQIKGFNEQKIELNNIRNINGLPISFYKGNLLYQSEDRTVISLINDIHDETLIKSYTNTADFGSNSDFLITLSNNKFIRWQLPLKEKQWSVPISDDEFYYEYGLLQEMKISPDSNVFIYYSQSSHQHDYSFIEIRTCKTGEQIWQSQFQGIGSSPIYTYSNKKPYLFLAIKNDVHVFNTKTMKFIHTFEHEHIVSSLTLLNKKGLLVTTNESGENIVWDISKFNKQQIESEKNKEEFKHKTELSGDIINFSNNKKYAAVVKFDNTEIQFYDVGSNKIISSFPVFISKNIEKTTLPIFQVNWDNQNPQPLKLINQVSFSLSGRLVAIDTGSSTTIWDWINATKIGEIPSIYNGRLPIILSNDDSIILKDGKEYEEGEMWSIKQNKKLFDIEYYKGWDISISKNEKLLTGISDAGSGSSLNNPYVISLEDGSLIYDMFSVVGILDVKFSPNKQYILFLYENPENKNVWLSLESIHHEKVILELDITIPDLSHLEYSFIEDGDFISVNDGLSIKVYNTQNGNLIERRPSSYSNQLNLVNNTTKELVEIAKKNLPFGRKCLSIKEKQSYFIKDLSGNSINEICKYSGNNGTPNIDNQNE